MLSPAPPRSSVAGAAALLAAALMLWAALWGERSTHLAAQAPTVPKPVSLAVWLHHFPGESEYLGSLTRSFKQATGRAVYLYTYEWASCTEQLKQWRTTQRAYAPDMAIVRDVDLPIVLGQAASLEGRFTPAFLREFYPGALAQGRVQGVLVALPWQVWPRALYYRGDVLRAKGLSPPKTPDDLLRVAQTVARPPELYGLGLPGRMGGSAAEMFLLTYRAQGGLLFDQDGHLAIASDAGRRTLHLWEELGRTHATEPEILNWDESELVDLFLAGRLAMLVERPWLLSLFHLAEPSFEVGVVPVPKVPGGWDSPRTDCIFVFETAGDLDGCVQFLQFALGAEQQAALAKSGVLSPRKDAAGALPADPRWAAFRAAMADARGPSPQNWDAIADLFDRLIYMVVSGRATADEAIDRINIDLLGEPDAERAAMPAPGPPDGAPRQKL